MQLTVHLAGIRVVLYSIIDVFSMYFTMQIMYNCV